jgi:predicted alpha/beta-fold hydrolase
VDGSEAGAAAIALALERSAAAFRPFLATAGGHRQTLLGYSLRRHLRWRLPVEERIVETEPGVRLLVRATWQPGPRKARPALVIVHGLGGSDTSAYVLSTGALAYARGWHVLRANMRGAGDGEALCARLYHAGLDTDLLAVLRDAASLVPRLAVVGFSLGGNLTLLAAGRRQAELPEAVRGVAAICTPLDLAACADALERPDNTLYEYYFMRSLVAAYRRRQALLPDLYEAGRERKVRSVRAFDERITAPYGGYRDAAEYYASSSSGPWLASIDRPTLILNAADDPMVPIASTRHWPLPGSGLVRREVTPTGGHMGFVGRSHAPGHFWAAERFLDFLEEEG